MFLQWWLVLRVEVPRSHHQVPELGNHVKSLRIRVCHFQFKMIMEEQKFQYINLVEVLGILGMGPSTPLGSPEVQAGSQVSTTRVLHLHDDRTLSSTTQVLHQRDNRTQAIHLGITHQEFGSVIAEAQRLLDDSRARAEHFKGIAQTIHNQACEQIVHLKGAG